MARHVKNQKKKRHGTTFWDHEYTKAEHLALSTEASDDLEKFTRWLERQTKRTVLNPLSSAADLGCGNGRNLLYLARTFGMRGVGIDTSAAAIKEAISLATAIEAPLTFAVGSIAKPLEMPDESQQLVLDMMSSHFLNAAERTQLRDEIFRILKPGGFLFFKTFLRDGDLHTERLIKERPGPEPNSYIHPVIGVPEYVYSEDELLTFLSERFIIHKTYASHKHVSKSKARKRRTIAIYAEKDPYE